MLAAALVCTLVAAAVNWGSRIRPNRAVDNVSKPLTTILVMWVAVAADGPRTATVLALIGLAFCLAGDVFLLESVDRFVAGLASFLVGHLVFVGMFVALGLDEPWWGVIALVVLTIHGAVDGRVIVRGAAREDAALRVPVTAYLIVITAMAVVGVMTGRRWAVAGVTAFVVSDTILGLEAFVLKRRWMPLAVMVTYHTALIGLALSLR